MDITKKTIKFTVYGDPKAKRRHRMFYNKHVGRIMSYADPKGKEEEDNLRMHAEKVRPEKLITDPIFLKIDFYMPIPKSFSKKKIEKAKHFLEFPAKRPDLDNLTKAVKDACNKIIWRDDAQIVAMQISKFYSDTPRTEVSIIELIGD